MASVCVRAVGDAAADVFTSIRAGRCPVSYALRVDKLLSKCHGHLPRNLEKHANNALNEYEAKCGAYTGKYTTQRPYQVDGVKPRRRRRRRR
jgi:hypothetical protein